MTGPDPRDWFPSGVAWALLKPEDPAGEPLPAERALLTAQALPERVAEFARGRQAARAALTALGVPDAAAFPVLREGVRGPRWPERVVGSISHSGAWAAAAAAWRRDYFGIGLDLERIRIARPQLVSRICLPEERDWLNGLPESQRSFGFALIFSAKESIYKALHPGTGVFLGYADALVKPQSRAFSTEGTPGDGAFTWSLLRSSGGDFPAGFEGKGRWQNPGEIVATAVWVRA